MFLCREKELSVLNKHYQSKTLECAVIYGRRRIGKTALINEFVKDKPTIYFPALNSNAKDNLMALSKAVYSYESGDTSSSIMFHSFDDVFSHITKIANKERVVFVIDELPYLANADSSIISRLQHLLDNEWKNSKLFLILCGSSISFMERDVLSEKSPLFGRRTMQLNIKPLTYLETAMFNPKLSNEENAIIYGITGGVPHYIRKLDVRKTIKDSLIDNLFETSSYLYEEPNNLLKQELREPSVYNSIITAIAEGSTRLVSIANAVGLDTSTCNKYISVLINLGIIEKIEPVLDKNKKKVIYRIADNFFRFWYRFVPTNHMLIYSGRIKEAYEDCVGSYINSYMGLIFEDICKQYLLYYAKQLPIQINDIGEWWGNNPVEKKEMQLDIVAIGSKKNNTKAGKNYIIGSCKFTNEKVSEKELDLIKHYASTFVKEKDKCYYIIFSKQGFTKELLEKEKKNEVQLIALNNMYKQ